jgi:hypothetical protein
LLIEFMNCFAVPEAKQVRFFVVGDPNHHPITLDNALRLSSGFTGEQRLKALAIWQPILVRLAPLLVDVQRLETWETPNGLIITSAAGWSLALCCLEGAPLPHFIAVRPSNPELSCAIRAYLQDGGYVIKEDNASTNGDSAAHWRPVLQAVLRRLGGRRLDAASESRCIPSPRQARSTRGKSAQRLGASGRWER